jgi:two-component system CheB/CheR fusion protein
MPQPVSPTLQGHVDSLLLREYSPAAAIINTSMEVLQFRGRTRDYLEHPSGTASLNILRMAREGLALDLRAAVSRALKQDGRVRQFSRLLIEGQIRPVTIEAVPFRLEAASERLILVLFLETPAGPVPDLLPARGRAATQAAHSARELDRVRAELAATRESLQTIIEEQEANNEELKSANEEIQSSNEELQSTNEELETAKEELQSTNEELTTLNEELSTRNQELTLALDDLTNLISSVNIAIVIVTEDLRIRRYTPTAERIFNLIPTDIGRRLGDLNRNILVADFDKSVNEVISQLTPMERDVQDRDGHWYSLRIRPYRTRENKISGAVVMLVDIDQLKTALDQMLTTANEPLLTLGSDLNVRRANDSFYRAFGLKREETEGRFIYELGQGQWNHPRLRNLLEEILPENKTVQKFELDAEFTEGGHRKLVINARRFYDEGWGTQIILLAINDTT